MKQLSNLTKIMFCIVAVLLVITVVLGIATAVKDGRENGGNRGDNTTVTPVPDNTGGAGTPTPTPEEPPEPTETPKHVVAIDPGQQQAAMTEKEPIGPGASDTVDKMSYGATSTTTQKREYEWTLLLSEKIKTELETRGYQVIMTRETSDVRISNAERAQAVNETDAEIYISIQADAAGNTSAKGIYTQIASKDNSYVKGLYKDSKALATAIQTRLISETGANDRGIKEEDNIPAINYCSVPTAVLQLGFMSNVEEDANLWTEEYQEKLVKAICDGIDAYFD